MTYQCRFTKFTKLHFNQLLTYSDPDCTTNCCESINSGLNKDCPALRTPNAVFNKVLKHKRGFLNKYAYVVKLDNLSVVRRPKKMTDKYEILLDLCEAFDNFSESERKLNLFKYLGLFSRRDAIPDQYYEDPDDLETVPQLNFHVTEKLLFASERARSADSGAIFGFEIEER